MSNARWEQLAHLAQNLWWSWDGSATNLWEQIDSDLWSEVHHNPVALLEALPESRRKEIDLDKDFGELVAQTTERMRAALSAPSWCERTLPDLASGTVAYLCMEYGLHESLRLYSGGLGVLAGDHLRSASDLGVPLVAIGLAYREGYFQQSLSDGQQQAHYARACFERSLMVEVTTPDGEPLRVSVPIGPRSVQARVWRIQVGRVPLFLLDTDLEESSTIDRALTHRLYSGDSKMRIEQEVLLGFGAVRMLRALDIQPSVWHLNEGHSAFSSMERMAQVTSNGASLNQALDDVRRTTLFTTHTPVPAGHDRFEPHLCEATLGPWLARSTWRPEDMMALGRVHPDDPKESLCMTVVALRSAGKANGVSALHGEVTRSMWADLYPQDEASVPIGHVTNGVHPFFWVARETQALFDETCPGWREAPWDERVWEPFASVSDARLSRVRGVLRGEILNVVEARTGITMDPHRMTVGFARRFATYKRGDLVFRQPERLRAILDQGVQMIFAGKAHPADLPGQAMIQKILAWCDHPWFKGRIAFLEDYDITLGRCITAGSDVWLNTPVRPREASGTSGQKASLNGSLNLSTIDGWWPEGYDGTNGWTIGDTQEHQSSEDQDAYDAEHLYRTLEDHVLPEWQARTSGDLSPAWCQRVRKSVQTCAPRFSSHRMVRDYALDWYEPLRRAGT